MKKRTTTTSVKETQTLARELSVNLTGGDVVCLNGELGSGKTTFVQGLATGLGVKGTVHSPTFLRMQLRKTSHPSIKALCHIDAYRIEDPNELREIGAFDHISQENTVTIVEWADRVKDVLPKCTVTVTLEHGKKENEREITIT